MNPLTSQMQIDKLIAENRELRQRNNELENNVIKVIQRVDVEPPDYQENIKRLKLLTDENIRLKKIIERGNISTLMTLIDEFKTSNKNKLERIIEEYQFYLADVEEKDALIEFIHYLQSVIDILQDLLIVGGENE